jgi:hypothetical protein
MRSLSTSDIHKEIYKDTYAKRIFKGVFPRDKLPHLDTYHSSFIVNTHPSTYPGEHWLAFYFDKSKHCEFFDSFGFSLEFYGFKKYITRYSTSNRSNLMQIQDIDSIACGYYCIYFILLKSRGFSLEHISRLFSESNFILNDYLISHILK